MLSWQVPVLMYHEISAQPLSAGRLAVGPDQFADQLSYLRDGGYACVTADALGTALDTGGAGLPARPVALTFDDGFADFYDTALPLLLQHGFTASLYVTTGWVNGESAHRGMLSWPAIEAAHAAGIEIGAHSVHHPQLDQLAASSLRAELADCKHALEDRLGAPVPGLAYPFGYSSQLVRDTAAEVGYAYACAVGNRLAADTSDRFALPRLTIARSTSAQCFARAVQARRLPAEFTAYRVLTGGWTPVRRVCQVVRKVTA
jgi:peptidoglycan/xylan/chitin deacetylase (PgdA/CDA1 family)